MNRDPIVTQNDDGSLSVEWPNPPRATYEVSGVLLAEMLGEISEYRMLKKRGRDSVGRHPIDSEVWT